MPAAICPNVSILVTSNHSQLNGMAVSEVDQLANASAHEQPQDQQLEAHEAVLHQLGGVQAAVADPDGEGHKNEARQHVQGLVGGEVRQLG